MTQMRLIICWKFLLARKAKIKFRLCKICAKSSKENSILRRFCLPLDDEDIFPKICHFYTKPFLSPSTGVVIIFHFTTSNESPFKASRIKLYVQHDVPRWRTLHIEERILYSHLALGGNNKSSHENVFTSVFGIIYSFFIAPSTAASKANVKMSISWKTKEQWECRLLCLVKISQSRCLSVVSAPAWRTWRWANKAVPIGWNRSTERENHHMTLSCS